jgi:hypothetical protein
MKTKPKINKDIITIGDEYSGEDTPASYICNYCNRTLSRLIDSGGQIQPIGVETVLLNLILTMRMLEGNPNSMYPTET